LLSLFFLLFSLERLFDQQILQFFFVLSFAVEVLFVASFGSLSFSVLNFFSEFVFFIFVPDSKVSLVFVVAENTDGSFECEITVEL